MFLVSMIAVSILPKDVQSHSSALGEIHFSAPLQIDGPILFNQPWYGLFAKLAFSLYIKLHYSTLHFKMTYDFFRCT